MYHPWIGGKGHPHQIGLSGWHWAEWTAEIAACIIPGLEEKGAMVELLYIYISLTCNIVQYSLLYNMIFIVETTHFTIHNTWYTNIVFILQCIV